MTTIDLKSIPWAFEKGSIIVSEKDVQFDTSYSVVSPKTGDSKQFNFTHSTGSEWAADTRWVYKSSDNLLLEVSNDAEMVKKAAGAYLKAKVRSFKIKYQKHL